MKKHFSLWKLSSSKTYYILNLKVFVQPIQPSMVLKHIVHVIISSHKTLKCRKFLKVLTNVKSSLQGFSIFSRYFYKPCKLLNFWRFWENNFSETSNFSCNWFSVMQYCYLQFAFKHKWESLVQYTRLKWIEWYKYGDFYFYLWFW